MSQDAPSAPIPPTQHAIQFVGHDEVVLNRTKPVGPVGPTQVLARIEAVGICFSDTKLLHAWTDHPRKGPVVTGLSQDVLAEIPSYVPGETPTVPGHEVCARIVAVGDAVTRHRVGERILVQTDYRSLMTSKANAAFGYDFEGGLQEYVVMDERMIIESDTGERFLIPVGEGPSASSVALLEPWACVERAYASTERDRPKAGGRMLLVAEAGHVIDGLDTLIAETPPGSLVAVVADAGQRTSLEDARSCRGDPILRDRPRGSPPRGLRRHRLLRRRCRATRSPPVAPGAGRRPRRRARRPPR